MSKCFIILKVDNLDHFKLLVKNRLSQFHEFVQNRNSTVFSSEQCLVYKTYKPENSVEDYYDILPINLAIYMCKFRTMNHKFPIEKGRYFNIERADRICNLCAKKMSWR